MTNFYFGLRTGGRIEPQNFELRNIECRRVESLRDGVLFWIRRLRGNDMGDYGNPYRFTGRRAACPERRRGNEETGLYYYRARMYAPAIGRFMQTDPIGYADSMNLYQYCGNNPVNCTDPFGLAVGVDDAVVISGGATAVKSTIVWIGGKAVVVTAGTATALGTGAAIVGGATGRVVRHYTGLGAWIDRHIWDPIGNRLASHGPTTERELRLKRQQIAEAKKGKGKRYKKNSKGPRKGHGPQGTGKSGLEDHTAAEGHSSVGDSKAVRSGRFVRQARKGTSGGGGGVLLWPDDDDKKK